MKACSKCGRTYPDHVDFCLRDGHPLVAGAEESAPPEPETPEPPAEGEGRDEKLSGQTLLGIAPEDSASESGEVPLDLRTTTDAFFPALAQSHGIDDPEELAALTKTIEAELGDSVSSAETDVIGVAQFRAILARHRESKREKVKAEQEQVSAAEQPFADLATDKFAVQPVDGDQSLVQTTLIPRNWKESVPDSISEGEEGTTEPASVVEDLVSTTPLATFDKPEVTGELSRPFFVDDGDDIPTGFEESFAPEVGEEETTGALSQPFISGTDEEVQAVIEENDTPWEPESQPEGESVGRVRHATRELSLEAELKPNGAVPPNGSFRRRAAFSHWPTPAAPEPRPPAEPAVANWSIEPPPERPPAPKAAPLPPVVEDDYVPAPSPGPARYVLIALLMIIGIAGAAYVVSGGGNKTENTSAIHMSPQQQAQEAQPEDLAAQPEIQKEQPQSVGTKLPVELKEPSSEDVAVEAGAQPAAQGSEVAQPVAAVPEKVPESKPAPAQPKAQKPEETTKVASTKKPKRSSVKAPASLKVISSPTGAIVFVEGTAKGPTPYTSRMVPGNYSVRVEKEGYRTETRRAKLQAGDGREISVVLTPLSQKPVAPVAVLIISNEVGASVYLNGSKVGETPARQTLAPGSYKMRVVKEGYKPTIQDIEIKASEGTAAQKVFASLAKE